MTNQELAPASASRRICTADDARAYLDELANEVRRPSIPLEQAEEWLPRFRKRMRGLPLIQLLAEDVSGALEQGTLEYVGLLFLPRRAHVAQGVLVWGTLSLVGGRLSLSELALAPLLPSEQALTADLLRRISLSAILARVHAELINRAELAELARRFAWPAAPSAEEQAKLDEAARRATAGQPRRGRPALADAHLARIARAYLRKQADGYSRGILLALAEEEGRPRDTIRDWVAKARRRGFLSPGTQGRAGALPGPRLQELPMAPAKDESTSPT
jgi:hypothetical protein